MLLQRPPIPRLRAFVKALWTSQPENLPQAAPVLRGRLLEHVLPTGGTHLVVRLSGPPLRILSGISGMAGGTGQAPQELRDGIVGGARSAFYVKDVTEPGAAVGALLVPGAAELLFGVPADVLAERHTSLGDLWGPVQAALVTERLQEAPTPAGRLCVFEALLAQRLPLLRALHPAVAQALQQIGQPLPGGVPPSIGELVRGSGYSHRQFVALFRRSVGLPPKTYARVLRFQRLLGTAHALARSGAPVDWAGLALEAGFSDQPHFNREFRSFTGVAPEAYRKQPPEFANHLAVPQHEA